MANISCSLLGLEDAWVAYSFCKYDVNVLVNNYISPVEFLVWTVLFTHILVVITDGGSEDESSDRDKLLLQTTGKNQVN